MKKRSLELKVLISAALVACSLGCRIETRAGYNEEDLQESIKIAEDYLQNLKSQKYDAALQLTTARLQSLITADNLRTDFEARFEGEPIQTWTLKSRQIIAGAPRRIGLLFQVQNSMVAHDVAITTELVPGPYRWQVASVKTVNDPAADKNAEEAKRTAEEFLVHLRAHDYAAAHQLTSTLSQKSMTQDGLRDSWEILEQRHGTVTSWR